MGFKPNRRHYRLKFSNPELEGLEVEMTSLTIEQFFRLMGLSSAENMAGTEGIFQMFAGALVSWNVEDEAGEPVPATIEGVRSQELSFIYQIIVPWMEAMTSVDPKGQPSLNGGGKLGPEELLDLESLSKSLKN